MCVKFLNHNILALNTSHNKSRNLTDFKIYIVIIRLQLKEFKGEIWSLFYLCVNAMGRRTYCPSRMEVSNGTSRFGAIIRRDLHSLSLPCDSPRDNLYAYVIWVHAGKATHAYEIIGPF